MSNEYLIPFSHIFHIASDPKILRIVKNNLTIKNLFGVFELWTHSQSLLLLISGIALGVKRLSKHIKHHNWREVNVLLVLALFIVLFRLQSKKLWRRRHVVHAARSPCVFVLFILFTPSPIYYGTRIKIRGEMRKDDFYCIKRVPRRARRRLARRIWGPQKVIKVCVLCFESCVWKKERSGAVYRALARSLASHIVSSRSDRFMTPDSGLFSIYVRPKLEACNFYLKCSSIQRETLNIKSYIVKCCWNNWWHRKINCIWWLIILILSNFNIQFLLFFIHLSWWLILHYTSKNLR